VSCLRSLVAEYAVAVSATGPSEELLFVLVL
jgi:hypothetical protein